MKLNTIPSFVVGAAISLLLCSCGNERKLEDVPVLGPTVGAPLGTFVRDRHLVADTSTQTH